MCGGVLNEHVTRGHKSIHRAYTPLLYTHTRTRVRVRTLETYSRSNLLARTRIRVRADVS